MSVDLFINFDGNCREAVEYYAKVFRSETPPRFMTFGEMPPDPRFPITDEMRDLVMYSSLPVSGSNLMFSDVTPGMKLVVGNNISITVGSTDMSEIDRMYEEMKAGGSVEMELQETFWSKRYGAVTDRYGIHWQFSHDDGRPAI